MISREMIEREKYCNKGKAGLSRPSGTKPKAEIRDNQQDISVFSNNAQIISFYIRVKIIWFSGENEANTRLDNSVMEQLPKLTKPN